jgi:hypothetical protein
MSRTDPPTRFGHMMRGTGRDGSARGEGIRLAVKARVMTSTAVSPWLAAESR